MRLKSFRTKEPRIREEEEGTERWPSQSSASRNAVLEAIEEFDRLGREAFLDKYDFGPAREYFVRYRGRLYDSKALSGAAYGLQFPDRRPMRSADFTGGMQTSVATLQRLGFEVISTTSPPLALLREGQVYTWSELGSRFGFAANYLGIAGGMVPRPEHDAVLLITHPEGGRSFDYGDYWDGEDLIYTGRGLDGNQRLEGANLDVAENRRQLLLFEHAGPRRLIYLSEVTCAEHWETMAPDRAGRDRRVYRFRLNLSSAAKRSSARGQRDRRASERTRQRASSSFLPRPFDPNRTAPRRRRGQIRDPDRQRTLAEQATRGHQNTLRALGLRLSASGWSDIQEIDGATELMAQKPRGSRRVLFEIKTLTAANEREAVRGGLAQLLEYKYFLGSEDDSLCLVTNRPIDDRRLQLLDSIGIGHAYIEDDAIRVSGTRASRQVFGRSTS